MQNLLILIGSYVFYAWWDWRFLSLVIFASALNYFIGIGIHKATNDRTRKILLFVALFQGLGLLFLFKYADFYITSLREAFGLFNIKLNIHTLRLILPLGISFYTFRTVSYILDIYKGKIEPTIDPVVFFSFVAFFPSLISGPIDRASTLIPQLENKRVFNYPNASDGMRQILWGLFKKLVIADNCAGLTNQIFDNYLTYPASSLVLGAFFFTIQLYTDFSGYSDMAIGFARLLGFNITRNFSFPFYAQNIAEFWQKWHTSLTSWMTDYVFSPLNIAFRDFGNTGLILAIFINFLAVGAWHGANWTFILYGFLQACFFVPMILKGTLFKKKKIAGDKRWPSRKEFGNMLMTFILVMLANIIFRVNSIAEGLMYFKRMASFSLFSMPEITNNRTNAIIVLFFTAFLLVFEWFQRDKQHALQIDMVKRPFARMIIYYVLLFYILYFGSSANNQFIYFKF